MSRPGAGGSGRRGGGEEEIGLCSTCHTACSWCYNALFRGPVAESDQNGAAFHDIGSKIPEPLNMAEERDKAEILM
eukprot:753983-Hanusia_phi.AAC.3